MKRLNFFKYIISMLYTPTLFSGLAQSSSNPPLFGSPAGAPGFSSSACATNSKPLAPEVMVCAHSRALLCVHKTNTAAPWPRPTLSPHWKWLTVAGANVEWETQEKLSCTSLDQEGAQVSIKGVDEGKKLWAFKITLNLYFLSELSLNPNFH